MQLSKAYPPITVNTLHHRHIIQFLCNRKDRLHLGITQMNLVLLSFAPSLP